jgi:hypothetical protein
MTSPATKYAIGSQVEIKLPAGWRAGQVKREILNYTKSGGTVYEITGRGFVSITSAATLRHSRHNGLAKINP